MVYRGENTGVEKIRECSRRKTGGSYGGGGFKGEEEKGIDKGDSSSKIKRGYRGEGGRQVIEKAGRGYRGDVRNINRGSGLPAEAHSAPNTYCHSD